MGARVIAAVAVSAVVVATAANPASPAKPKTVVCGQIKAGPHVTYTTLVSHQKLSGSTWTVFATGVPCAKALSTAPSILRGWAKTAIGHVLFAGSGFTCTKESDGHGSAGSSGCAYNGPDHGLDNIELIMTGPYGVAQLKALYGIG